MKIVAISDMHNRYGALKLPEADTLVCSGDLTGAGNFWEAEDFAKWLKDQDYAYKVVIAGNHDWAFQERPEECKDLIEKAGGIYLENSAVTIEGIKFWGSPWTPRFFDWAFNADHDQLKALWDKIPFDTDVLITHGPPYGILDVNREGDNCGCELLLDAVKRVKPQFHIFGHIHEGRGFVSGPPTAFVNASIVDRNYRVITLDGWDFDIHGPKLIVH